MKSLLSVLLWLPFAAAKIVVVVFSVLVYFAWYRNHDRRPPVFLRAEGPRRLDDAAVDNWNDLVRNPAGGFAYLFEQPGVAIQRGIVVEPITAERPWLQWRWRRWGWFSSFRFALRWPFIRRYWDFYIGWKIDALQDRESARGMDFALSVLRVFAKYGE